MVRLLLPPGPSITLASYTGIATLFWLHNNGHVALMSEYLVYCIVVSIFTSTAMWWVRVCVFIHIHHHNTAPLINTEKIDSVLKFISFQASTLILIDSFYTCKFYSCNSTWLLWVH